MKTPAEITRERDKLLVVCQDGSPVPFPVREAARRVCHTLSWVLDDSVSIQPYYNIAGCCCYRVESWESMERGCALGRDLCLCPSGDVAPDPPVPRRLKSVFRTSARKHWLCRCFGHWALWPVRLAMTRRAGLGWRCACGSLKARHFGYRIGERPAANPERTYSREGRR